MSTGNCPMVKLRLPPAVGRYTWQIFSEILPLMTSFMISQGQSRHTYSDPRIFIKHPLWYSCCSFPTTFSTDKWLLDPREVAAYLLDATRRTKGVIDESDSPLVVLAGIDGRSSQHRPHEQRLFTAFATAMYSASKLDTAKSD